MSRPISGSKGAGKTPAAHPGSASSGTSAGSSNRPTKTATKQVPKTGMEILVETIFL